MPKTAALEFDTVRELLERLGNVPPSRVLMKPLPGEATEADLLRLLGRKERICELVDGTLVEKPMGAEESSLAGWIIYLLHDFLVKHNLGKILGADGALRLEEGLVRVPDISFIRWENVPDRTAPLDRLPALPPDLAVEVLSEDNTPAEMRRKRGEYFSAGTQLVWMVDPVKRTVAVYTDPETSTTLTEADTLDGGAVLPGFRLTVRRLFETTPPMKKGRRKKS